MPMEANGQKASNPGARLASLLTKREKLQDELRNIEKQVFELETTYLQDSNHFGHVLKGFEGFLGSSKSATNLKRPRKFQPEDRIFSLSSVTSPASNSDMVTPTLSQRADAADEKIGEIEGRLQSIEQKFGIQVTHLKTIAEKLDNQEATIEKAIQAAVAGILEAERKRTEENLARTTHRLEERLDRFRMEHDRLAAIEKENNLKFRRS
uniref:Uncharacterized protein n=1 Tax=Chenopodium quinoa TaxID=63459 RepID=A0A803LMR4_CHEQI